MQVQTPMQPMTDEAMIVSSGHCPACGTSGALPIMDAPDRYYGRKQAYQLVRCPSCELVWLSDPPRPDEMVEHYGSDYDQMIAGAGEAQIEAHWRGPRKRLLAHKSGGDVLDLGCSSGGFLASLGNTDWRLHGVEISDQVAERARARTGAQIYVGDVLDAPFLPESFDAITCFHVFEHMYHPREVMQKVQQWLRPGGVFVVYVPNIDSAGARIFKSYWYALELPRHLYHFSPTSLRKLAKTVGLEEVFMATSREVFIETSCRYVIDDVLCKLGMPRPPLAKASPSLPFRAIRKLFRLTALPLLNGLAGAAGDGEIIHAVFRKPMV